MKQEIHLNEGHDAVIYYHNFLPIWHVYLVNLDLPNQFLNYSLYIDKIGSRVENFLGFEFLVRNEEIDGHSHEERGIFEESFSPIFTFIFSYICYQKGAKLFPKKPPYFWNTIFDPNTIFIAFLSINIF